MPVQYRGILEEHRAVRERVGLFDRRHGRALRRGPCGGRGTCLRALSDPRALKDGRAQYSMIAAPDGGILDDLIVYRLGEARFLVVANASNALVVSRRARRAAGRLRWRSSRPPLPATALIDLARVRWTSLRRTRMWTWARCAGWRDHAARRGWRRSLRGPATRVRTGSRSSWMGSGYELWDVLMPAVSGGLPPARRPRHAPPRGWHAAVRQRARHVDEPFEAGLGRVVKLTKPGDFVGRAAFERAASAAPTRRRAGRGRAGIARHGYPVRRGAADRRGHQRDAFPDGSPIAMAYVAADAEPGDSRGRNPRSTGPGRVVPLPFYKRGGT